MRGGVVLQTAPGWAQVAGWFPGVQVAFAPVDGVTGELLPCEAEGTAGASPKRRAEFRAGRILARALLREMGAEGPILRGDRGAPRWPAGVMGSIAHSGGWCGVAAARAGDYLSLGLDLEDVSRFHPLLALRLLGRWGPRLPEFPPVRLAALSFSAREAAFKAISPLAPVPSLGDLELRMAPAPRGEEARFQGAWRGVQARGKVRLMAGMVVALAAVEGG